MTENMSNQFAVRISDSFLTCRLTIMLIDLYTKNTLIDLYSDEFIKLQMKVGENHEIRIKEHKKSIKLPESETVN